MATFAGEVEVTVTPDTAGFGQRLETEVLPAAERAAQKIGRTMGAAIGRLVTDGVKDGLDRTVARAEIVGVRAGRKFGKEFARMANAEIRAALKDQTVGVRVDVDTASFTASIAELKRKIASIRDKDITINISVERAINNLLRLEHRLKQVNLLARMRIRVDVEGGERARLELDMLLSRLRRFGATRATARVNVSGGAGAHRSIGMLVAAIATLGMAFIPVAAASAAAMAGIVMGAMAAAGAVGVLLLALWPVIQAVAAVTQAQSKQANTAATAASRTAQLANASDALKAAQEGVAEAVRSGRRDMEQASRAIDRARRTEREAAQEVLEAERELAEARAEWAGDQEDLQDRILQGSLNERQAVLDLKRAEEERKNASAEDREQAELNYLQALKRLQDIRDENAELAEEQGKSAQAGVEGSKKVQDAQKGVTDAKLRQKDAEQEVRDAVVAAAEAQRQAARSVADANQQVIQAQRALQQASTSAGMAGSSAMQTMQDKMAALTAEGRRFVLFLTGPMRDALSGLSAEAQRGFLPGMQSGLEALLPVLPGFAGFVGGLAKTMGDLADESGRALAGPWWQQFFAFVDQTAAPVLDMMGATIGNLVTGLAGLFEAMAPAGMDFGKGLLDASKAFADFGKGAKNNKDFQEFLATVRRDGPIVVDAIKEFVAALGNVGRALEPFGAGLLKGFTDAMRAIADMDPATIRNVTAAVVAVVAAYKLWSLAVAAVAVAQGILNGALWANPVGLIVAAILIAIGVIVAWGLALKKLYEENETFRTVVTTVWDAIKTAVSWVWSNVLKPAFEWIVTFVMTKLVPAFMWLWQNAIVPAFEGIKTAVSWAWANVIKPVFEAVAGFVMGTLIPAFKTYLWPAIQFVWQAIGVAIQLAWSVIQVIFKIIEAYVRNVLGPVFQWLYSNVIKPVWENGIRPAFQALADFLGAHVVPAFRSAVSAIGSAWSMVADAAKTPIEFIVETVINKGIIGSWNKIASWFGVAPVDTLVLPWRKGPSKPTEGPGSGPGNAFAGGGQVRGPGTGTSDSIPAWLSDGEFIIRSAAVRKLGVNFLQLLNRADRLDIAGDPSSLVVRGFADGGSVDAAKAWLPSTDPLPYVWGGVGPGGYDCSGLSGEVWNRVTGHPSYRRVFTTGSLLASPSRFGLKAGRGLLTFGVSDTHMDGSLGGLGFEAKGRASGILIGSGARPTSTFPHEFYLDDLGGGHDDAGGLGINPLDPIGSVRALFSRALASLSKVTGSPFGAMVAHLPRKAVDVVVDHLAQVWADKASLSRIGFADGGLVGRPTLYDQGGWLQPGLTTVLNASKTPEPVFSGQQWDRLSQGGLADSRPNLSVQVHNPIPEPASESTTRMMRRLGYARADA